MKCKLPTPINLASLLILLSIGVTVYVTFSAITDQHLDAIAKPIPHFNDDWFYAQSQEQLTDRIDELHAMLSESNMKVTTEMDKAWNRVAILVVANMVFTFSVLLIALIIFYRNRGLLRGYQKPGASSFHNTHMVSSSSATRRRHNQDLSDTLTFIFLVYIFISLVEFLRALAIPCLRRDTRRIRAPIGALNISVDSIESAREPETED